MVCECVGVWGKERESSARQTECLQFQTIPEKTGQKGRAAGQGQERRALFRLFQCNVTRTRTRTSNCIIVDF